MARPCCLPLLCCQTHISSTKTSKTDAHDKAIEILKAGWAPLHHPSALEQRMGNLTSTPFRVPTKDGQSEDDDERGSNGALTFDNPIGLAAGFDKDGVVIQPLFDLGFCFVEVGSVTLQPQPGNPKPRMFRYVEDQAIINRYGFNSKGADAVEQELKELYNNHATPTNHQPQQLGNWLTRLTSQGQGQAKKKRGVVGINLGKNKGSTTPVKDYQLLIGQLGPYADYLVINVSSPNTPGLRDLQEKNILSELLSACLDARNQLATRPPLLVKLAPDLTDEELQEIAIVLMEVRIDGMILTNTTNQRPASFLALSSPSSSKTETGGLSGRPLCDISTERIRTMYYLTNGTIPIIGVGGIFTAQDVYDKMKAGASLVQVYSSLVYEGPGLVSKLRHDLAKLLLEQGHRRLDEVIGSDHAEIHWRKQQQKARLATAWEEKKTEEEQDDLDKLTHVEVSTDLEVSSDEDEQDAVA
jgi:dihydroorotate dehydrogenase